MQTILSLLPLAAWFLVWGTGGWLASRSAFQLSRPEQMPVALITGFSLQILFANMLSMLLPPLLSFWLGALLVLALGAALAFRIHWRELVRLPILPGQMLVLLGTFWVIFLIQRGLAIFDDFAHLPTLSLMATGDVPPHFPYDPSVPYAYHHFLLLFGAQIARLGSIPVWVAMDIARAIAFAVTALLAAAWVQRLTRSLAAGALGYLMVVFGSGTRWLLLLFPHAFTRWLSPVIQMIGSGKGSGPDFATAMLNNWAVEGVGQISIPFAFANGIFAPGILAGNGPNGVINIGTSIFFLQTFNHWRSWRGGLLSAFMMATFALQTEAGVVISLAGWGVITLLVLLQRRTWKLPANLWHWLVVVAAGNLLGALQGSALTDIAVGAVRETQGAVVASYQTVGFILTFNPALVSAHLGVLHLTSVPQLLAALLELGPILLVIPLLIVWGFKAYRASRWYEAAFILSSLLSLGSVFILFSGSTGVRNTTRLYSFVNLFLIYAVPLFWIWVVRRAHTVKLAAGLLALVVMFGGFVMLGILLPATQRPVASYFLNALDARMYQAYWNRLEPGALVFDPEPSRATTVLGRGTNAAYTWYAFKPEWQALVANPDPYELRAAGYRYLYLDNRYVDQLDPAMQQRLQDGCLLQIEVYTDSQGNFRQLYDLDSCRK